MSFAEDILKKAEHKKIIQDISLALLHGVSIETIQQQLSEAFRQEKETEENLTDLLSRTFFGGQ